MILPNDAIVHVRCSHEGYRCGLQEEFKVKKRSLDCMNTLVRYRRMMNREEKNKTVTEGQQRLR